MIIDGKAVAAEILKEVQNEISHRDTPPHLTVATCAPNFETQKYLALKIRTAREVGIGISVLEFPHTITTEEIVASLQQACFATDGLIVQLPLPAHLTTDVVLEAIPTAYDVDAFGYDGTTNEVLPPVVGAIAELAARYNVEFVGKHVVVVGHGRLVGKPAEIWAAAAGCRLSLVTKDTPDKEMFIKAADILILGAGVPHHITQDMITPGVVIFDAGTSEDGGVLRGDAHPDCAEIARLYTPVPGGIGPVTVAVLLRNLLVLTRQ